MKILFLEIDQEREWAVASLGPAFIGAYLRQHGHEAVMVRIAPDLPVAALVAAVDAHAPGLIGVSMTSRQWLRARDVIASLREHRDIPVIAGGLQATFATETVMNSAGFDYVCRGEGEVAMLELVTALEQRPAEPPGPLRNIVQTRPDYISVGGAGSAAPELHPPFSPIDALPFMARDLLDETHGVVHMATQRGCPYPCTYCGARQFSDLYGSYADYGRRRSIENVLLELREIRANGPLNYITFLDDTFTINHAWVDEFCDAYGAEFAVPFSLHARVETVNGAMLERLAAAGCRHIVYGVESGSERVRRDIMKRHASNDMFREVFSLTRAAGIMVTANYIIGTPGETRSDMDATLALHDELAPYDFGYFVFYPYPGTPLYELCLANGYLPENYYEMPANHRQSILTFESLSQADIEEYYDRFTEVRKRDQLGRLGADDPGLHETVVTAVEDSAALG